MKSYFLSDQNLSAFVEGLMSKYPVIAPVAKRSRFVFEKLVDASELRLDYDTTILPPKKVFFPAKQDLIHFDQHGFTCCIDPTEQVLLGAHPHDIKGIAMSDIFYSDRHCDNNYMANRKATTIIGSSVQNHYKHAFFGTMNAERPLTGHDLFMTAIEGGFAVDVVTERGEALLPLGTFEPATEAQVAAAVEVNRKAEEDCPEKLNGTAEEIREKVRTSFKSPVWEAFAEKCFSCGSCNIVCCTCYCFDVQDEWNVDGVSGSRFRLWDACLTREFSEVTSPGGSENFREERGERYRHRFMRKAAYLNEQLGGPACTGCGRCSGACTANIANPTTVINKLLEQ
ncbi:MAG: 4Fe-4S dicluster domain-containing protein [Lentisphaerae bacterium]|nr:4Fe-4S dicluster domain-containing protein [Lentisphaerota bacterium]